MNILKCPVYIFEGRGMYKNDIGIYQSAKHFYLKKIYEYIEVRSIYAKETSVSIRTKLPKRDLYTCE